MNRSFLWFISLTLLGLLTLLNITSLRAINRELLPEVLQFSQQTGVEQELHRQCFAISNTTDTRGGFRVISKNIEHYINNSSWGPYEQHDYLYEPLWMWLVNEDIARRYANGSWANYQKYVTDYLANQEINTYSTMLWQNNAWQNYYRSTYQYEMQGLLSGVLSQTWVSGAWQNSSQSIYTYDAEYRVASIVSQSWQNGNWVNSLRMDLTYETGEVMAEMLISLWSNSIWNPNSRMMYTHTNGNLTESVFQTWNSGANVFQNSSRMTYTYVADTLTQDLYEVWQNNNWVDQILRTYSYDDSGNNIETIQQNYSSGWLNTERQTMVYEFWDVANEDNTIPTADLSLYAFPNPFSGKTGIYIKSSVSGLAKLRIFNLKGQLITSEDVILDKDSALTWQWNEAVPAGIYFAEVGQNNLSFKTLKLFKY